MSNRPSWSEYWLSEAQLIASRSKDPSTKVGAVIVEPDRKRMVMKGYNGLPRGIPDTDDRLQHRPTKLALTLHAELNAILFAQRDLAGCILYSTQPPCAHCASVVIQVGIAEVVHPDLLVEWLEPARTIMLEAGVKVVSLGRPGGEATPLCPVCNIHHPPQCACL